jgi:hypothetical protein
MFLETSDFVGKYKIAKDCYSKDLLESYIDRYEKFYLQDLLGVTLYNAFVADLNDDDSPRPQSHRFREIFNERVTEDICGVMYRSDGILEMLKGYVYYHYVLDQEFKNTINGTVVNKSSFADKVALAKSTLEDRYNIATDTYISIQLYIMDNDTIYPEFAGKTKKLSFFGGAF